MSNDRQYVIAIPSERSAHRALAVAKCAGAVALTLLLLAGGARAWVNRHDAADLERRTAESLKRSVIAVRPRAGETVRKVSLPASLRGSSETPIFARSSGYLGAWHKTIGDAVKKGEPLATVEVPELQQELAQARALRNQAKMRQELAESNLRRWEDLRRTDSASEQEYEEKRSAAKQARADLEAAQANVKRLEQLESFRQIVAPFSGVIVRRNVDVGNLIASGTQELFALTQIDPLRLTVWVPQVYADEVKVGQEVAVRFPETQSKSVTARIEHLAGALDPVTRSRQVDIALDNKDGHFLPGAYAEATFNVSGGARALVVPANTLVIDQSGVHVVALDGESRVVKRPVKLGRDFGKEVEVLEGVAAGDVLVASPSDLLVQGEQVTPVEPQKKAEADKSGDKSKAVGDAAGMARQGAKS